jgi:predicted TIM-barrel fold metal-dependent hydrolase
MEPTAPLVDMHAHVLTRAMPRFDPAGTHPLREDYSAERYIETLDAHGIHYGVLAPSSRVGHYFDYQVRALRRHKRLRSTVIIPFDTDLYGFERLDSEGVVGVRLAFRELEAIPDLAGRDFRTFLHRIRDFDWHVHVHIDAARLEHVLAPLLEVGVKVVLDHFGRPGPQGQHFDRVLAAIAADRVWVKLSASY